MDSPRTRGACRLRGIQASWVECFHSEIVRHYHVFLPHPSRELRKRFARKPFQGAEPASSMFLFVGLDANYSPTIESCSSFGTVLEYHEDGVAFWQRHGVHHPFLLPDYRGDGRRYHRNFSRIGFSPENAHQVSFIELLHLPTVGRSKLVCGDLDQAHLRSLNSVILTGCAQHIFVSARVADLMRKTEEFPWLPKQSVASATLPVMFRDERRTVYKHLHFSNYGKFQRQLDEEASCIRRLMHDGCLLSSGCG